MDNSRMNRILKYPVVTEKMTILKDKKKRHGEPLNQYAFEVVKDANKAEIRTAVEQKFNVKVASIRTINVGGKNRQRWTQSGRTSGKSPDWKKAIVTLVKDNKIEFVEGV